MNNHTASPVEVLMEHHSSGKLIKMLKPELAGSKRLNCFKTPRTILRSNVDESSFPRGFHIGETHWFELILKTF